MATYSDEDLTAYLDNALDPEEHRAIDVALRADADLRRRIEALRLSQSTLRSAFDALLDQAPPAPPLPLPAAPKPARRAPVMAMAACLTIGALIGAGWTTWRHDHLTPANNWQIAVAEYQRLYVTGTLTRAAAPDDGGLGTLAHVSSVLGRDLREASVVPGLDYRRAQILGFNGSPLIQIAYLANGETPIALCVTRVSQGDTALSSTTLSGLASASWVKDGFGFILIGGTDIEQITQTAAALRLRL